MAELCFRRPHTRHPGARLEGVALTANEPRNSLAAIVTSPKIIFSEFCSGLAAFSSLHRQTFVIIAVARVSLRRETNASSGS